VNRTISTVALGAFCGLIALVAASGTAGAGPSHSYRGHVFLKPGNVKLRFRVDQNFVYNIHSGKIPLTCNRGTAAARVSTGPIIREKPPHRRAFGISFSGQGSDGYTTRFHFGGVLHGAHARGHFRYRFRKPSGRFCGTGGRLLWTAHQ
jgi:hypothetical protein